MGEPYNFTFRKWQQKCNIDKICKIETQVNAFTLIASHLSLYNDKNMM